MFGHGTFIYDPKYSISKFGSTESVADKVVELGMSHAWLRVHNKNGEWRTSENKAISESLRSRNISVGVWGWNDGNNVSKDIANAQNAISLYDPDCYIADIEHGVSGANWSVAKAQTFASAVKAQLGEKPLVVSSFGYIKTHEPEIMASLNDVADFFAPQVYWFWYPKPYMLPSNDPFLSRLPTNNSAAYAKVCLYEWRKHVSRPLILTGQAYWGEASGWTQARAEKKLDEFSQDFEAFGEIAGLNWWNFADRKAMSDAMMSTIAKADFAAKFETERSVVVGGVAEFETALTQPERNAEFDTAETVMIAAEGLFFRSEPIGGSDENKIAELSFGRSAIVQGETTINGYIGANVQIDGTPTDGFLFARYLRKKEADEIERAVQEAVSEWERFDRGDGFEHQEPYSSYINEMWKARGYPDISGKDRAWYWSAVFISFVLENASYGRTQFDIRHSTYIHESIQNRITNVDGDFWGYRLNEAKPQVGDIVCQWRGKTETTYDHAETRSRFESHTDIVIAVRENAVITLGGNVANARSRGHGVSVETKTFPLDENGFLPERRRVFALMKNRHRPLEEQSIFVGV